MTPLANNIVLQPAPVTPSPVYQPPVQQNLQQVGPSSEGLAVTGFILTLLGCGLVGFICSLIALNNMNSNHNQEGHGWAVAGVVLFIIEIIVAALAWGLISSFISSLANS